MLSLGSQVQNHWVFLDNPESLWIKSKQNKSEMWPEADRNYDHISGSKVRIDQHQTLSSNKLNSLPVGHRWTDRKRIMLASFCASWTTLEPHPRRLESLLELAEPVCLVVLLWVRFPAVIAKGAPICSVGLAALAVGRTNQLWLDSQRTVKPTTVVQLVFFNAYELHNLFLFVFLKCSPSSEEVF